MTSDQWHTMYMVHTHKSMSSVKVSSWHRTMIRFLSVISLYCPGFPPINLVGRIITEIGDKYQNSNHKWVFSVTNKIYMSLFTLSVLFFSSTVCIIVMTSYLIVTKMLMPALYCTKTFFFPFLTLFGHIILTTRLCSSSLIIIAYINNKYQVWSDLGIKTVIFHTKCDHRNPTVVHIKKLFPHNFHFLIHVWLKGNVKSSDKW